MKICGTNRGVVKGGGEPIILFKGPLFFVPVKNIGYPIAFSVTEIAKEMPEGPRFVH
jgi:hypothetical protein